MRCWRRGLASGGLFADMARAWRRYFCRRSRALCRPPITTGALANPACQVTSSRLKNQPPPSPSGFFRVRRRGCKEHVERSQPDCCNPQPTAKRDSGSFTEGAAGDPAQIRSDQGGSSQNSSGKRKPLRSNALIGEHRGRPDYENSVAEPSRIEKEQAHEAIHQDGYASELRSPAAALPNWLR